MKSIDDALELRARIMGCFELAEITEDEEERRRLLTFIIVGAGPTGVEMAGQIAELAQRTLKDSYREIDPGTARIILLDAAPAVLPPFGNKLGNAARARLEELGVEIQLNAMVTDVDAFGIEVKDPDGSLRRISAACKIWSAGVQGSPLGKMLADQTDADGEERDHADHPVGHLFVVAAEGKADIFLTYCTNAVVAKRENPEQDIVALPEDVAVGANYGLTVMKDASAGAQKLADYILSPKGQSVLTSHGFAPQE